MHSYADNQFYVIQFLAFIVHHRYTFSNLNCLFINCHCLQLVLNVVCETNHQINVFKYNCWLLFISFLLLFRYPVTSNCQNNLVFGSEAPLHPGFDPHVGWLWLSGQADWLFSELGRYLDFFHRCRHTFPLNTGHSVCVFCHYASTICLHILRNTVTCSKEKKQGFCPLLETALSIS